MANNKVQLSDGTVLLDLTGDTEPASGGRGSDGGEGADGCIIIYYRKLKPLSAGWFKDKNGKLVLERLDKRFIV